MKQRNYLTILLIYLLMIGTSFANEENVILKVSTWAGPQHTINSDLLQIWASEVEEVTNGTVKLNFHHDLAPPTGQLGLVGSGAADIGWIYHGHTPERFVLHRLLEMPLSNSASSAELSKAYWLTHEEFFQQHNEHKGVKLIAVGVHGPGQILSKDSCHSLDSLQNKSVRVGSPIMENLSLGLSMNPIYLPTPEIYQSGKGNVINASFITVETLLSYNLADVFNCVYEFPDGLYRGSFSIFINQNTWNRLSEVQKKQIMRVSGVTLSYKFGNVMDLADRKGKAHGQTQGVEFIKATETDVKKVNNILEEDLENWKEKVISVYDLNPNEIINFFESQLND
jgi:TRAP-type C4-dicarboxylate transport system substrate-binding protein